MCAERLVQVAARWRDGGSAAGASSAPSLRALEDGATAGEGEGDRQVERAPTTSGVGLARRLRKSRPNLVSSRFSV